jgi:Icc protein
MNVMRPPVRILQLSDPHLLADPRGDYRERCPLALLRHGLAEALRQLAEALTPPDLLLLSGDLCQDESWGGYVHLRDLLATLPLPVAVLAGNHDHTQLLRAALGSRATLAPAQVPLNGWRLLLLESHRPGRLEGWLGTAQLAWIEAVLAGRAGSGIEPLLVAVHHPPVPIGSATMDGIGLRDGARLIELLRRSPRVRGLVFGHVHQHWQGFLPGRPDLPLLGCPSTLCGFGPVQPCPLGRPDDPGGRLLELGGEGEIRQRLLRWDLPDRPTFI